MNSIYFSIFNPPISNVIPEGRCYLEQIARYLYYNAELQKATDILRQLPPVDYKKYKTTTLPFATFGGSFTARNRGGLVAASGLVTIDIDGLQKEEVEAVKGELWNYQECPPVLVFTSPSERGVKSIYYTDCTADNYGRAWSLIAGIIANKIGVEVDKSGKDITRACLLCHDSELYYTRERMGVIIHVPEVETPPSESAAPVFVPKSPVLGDKIEWAVNDIISQIETRNVDICPNYNEWLQVGFSIASQFGINGLNYFERISAPHGSQSVRIPEFYAKLCQHNTGDINIDTFFYLAKLAGIETTKGGHDIPRQFGRKFGRKFGRQFGRF